MFQVSSRAKQPMNYHPQEFANSNMRVNKLSEELPTIQIHQSHLFRKFSWKNFKKKKMREKNVT